MDYVHINVKKSLARDGENKCHIATTVCASKSSCVL